ncbi:hypothetical protein K788_00007155 (plasmid) [Paraburkholderia caribensis MBA4]|uniref:Uncharacterized protein n=1 Tax=Paraburkholderia caribensis MBA4 TaxID=1323664 RepID=A0A0N7JVW0_9BURK|nr:hypothetical protein [Paraburkholderia caribensis]ALL70309.1 hypothetical protein K788_00007155 [Paraburkholderia caribensis MBA4]
MDEFRPQFGVQRIVAGASIDPQLTLSVGPDARTAEHLLVTVFAMSAPDVRRQWRVSAPHEGFDLPLRAAIGLRSGGVTIGNEVGDELLDAARRLKGA